jgi:TonB-dependent starch-binding outer membrane protein SusC
MKVKLLALLMVLSVVSYAQNAVSGRVTDENDQGLPGVNVLIKGSSQGTVTDVDGAFTLQSVNSDATLQISFIGYSTQEIAVANRSSISVKLMPDITALDEVVVVGYGTSTVKALTGAVSSVNGKSLEAINPVRVEQALQGQLAGVQVSSNSGSPGGGLNIRIRGLSTNGDNAPLILVDGVPYGDDGLAALNPSDIETVDVLKDASAAIYGVRGANGVVIITTKQGKRNGKPAFEFTGYYGMQETAKKMSLLDAREFAILKNEMFAAGNLTPPYANVELGAGTDWQDEVFQKAPIQNYNLSITGGSEKSTYSIGGSYMDQEGIVGGDKARYKRYNARLNYTVDLAPKVTLQNVLLFTNENRKTLAENGISSVLFNAINASPIVAPFNTDGSFAYLEQVSEVINPLAQIANTFNDTRVNKLTGKQELTYKINNNFDVTGRAGYVYALVSDKNFSPLVWYGAGKAQNTAFNANLDPRTTEIATGVTIPINNSVSESRSTYFDYNLEAFLNFSREFGDHKVKAVVGTSMISNQGENLSGTAFNVPYNQNQFADISLTNGSDFLNNTSSWQFRSRLLSQFIRGEYNFKDRYLFSAVMRRDGSSKFGRNNRFGYFPSVSAGWVLSDESFFSSDFFQFAKVRASFGVLGNDRIPLNAYYALLGGEAVYPFNDQLANGIAIGALGNEDLKWETTQQTNLGVDLNFLGDKFSFSADYFVKLTKDLLFAADVSGVLGSYGAGGSPPIINAGNVRNRGFEFSLNYGGNITKDLSINIGYNLTTIKNEVTELPIGVDFFSYGAFSVGGGSSSRMQVGYPIGYFFGYETDGVYQSAEDVTSRGVTQNLAQAGDLRYVDQDGDNVVNFGNNSDKVMIGSPIPDVTMGLNLGLNFKGFDFSTLLYASIGNEILRNYERQLPLANQLTYKINRWTGPNSTNEDPRLTTGLNNNNVLSDYFVEDGSFLRIRNLQLGYTLPSGIAKKIGATRLRFYVAGNNLVTFTRYRGFDPDLSNDSPVASGVDYGFYPQARTYMAGLNLNF